MKSLRSVWSSRRLGESAAQTIQLFGTSRGAENRTYALVCCDAYSACRYSVCLLCLGGNRSRKQNRPGTQTTARMTSFIYVESTITSAQW